MDHDAGVRQRIALPLFAGGEKEGAHGCGHAETDRIHLRTDEAHRVEDRHAGRNRAAGAVDVKRNVLVRIFAFQEEKLRDDERSRLIVHLAREKNDAIAKQTRINIEAALCAAGTLNNDRNKRHWILYWFFCL